MPSIPKRLKKEPLIEAIWQALFEPLANQPIGDILPGILYSELKNSHPGLRLQRLPAADIPAPVAQIDPSLRFAAKYRMEKPGDPFMFQVGDRVITLNCRRPYAGWTTFREKILSLIEIIESSHLVPAPRRYSLRYIDLLTLDLAPSLSSLQLSLKLGAFDTHARPLQARVELLDGDCTHVVQIATPAQTVSPQGKEEGAIVDIETFFTEPSNGGNTSNGWNTIATRIDHLHDRAKALFFENILTEEAIRQMEPEG